MFRSALHWHVGERRDLPVASQRVILATRLGQRFVRGWGTDCRASCEGLLLDNSVRFNSYFVLVAVREKADIWAMGGCGHCGGGCSLSLVSLIVAGFAGVLLGLFVCSFVVCQCGSC